jgi:hypothetical protein
MLAPYYTHNVADAEQTQFCVRVPKGLFKEFKKWCVDNEVSLQEAIRRFMSMMTEPANEDSPRSKS